MESSGEEERCDEITYFLPVGSREIILETDFHLIEREEMQFCSVPLFSSFSLPCIIAFYEPHHWAAGKDLRVFGEQKDRDSPMFVPSAYN